MKIFFFEPSMKLTIKLIPIWLLQPIQASLAVVLGQVDIVHVPTNIGFTCCDTGLYYHYACDGPILSFAHDSMHKFLLITESKFLNWTWQGKILVNDWSNQKGVVSYLPLAM